MQDRIRIAVAQSPVTLDPRANGPVVRARSGELHNAARVSDPRSDDRNRF